MAATQNELIGRLPSKDRLRLMALCEPVQLVLGEVLCEPGTDTRNVYFPVDGFVSLVAAIDGEPALEVGMVGREGMLGAQLALGVARVPMLAVVQGEGLVSRISAAEFRGQLALSPPLQRLLNRYVYVTMVQLASSAACIRFHQIGPRLARWLLMSQDRAHADHFHITHQFLAYMLGVRRVGITTAAGMLQRQGLIQYRRGEIVVLNRSGLEAASCACYASDLRAYQESLE